VARKTRFLKAYSLPFWALVAFLIIAFLTGGASRADVQSLIVLRPVAVIFCGIALWNLRWSHIQQNRFLFGMAVAIFVLVGSHLVPLPPSIWGALPGREIITEIDKSARLGGVWRPISMVPPATWNAFYSLFVPFTVLLFGMQLNQDDRFKLLGVILVLGLFSGFLGILQVIGDPQSSLYLYRITNNGSAVGLFSNRNHQAILLAILFPILAVFANKKNEVLLQSKAQLFLALAASFILIPLLLVTGSRAGIILGFLGLLSTVFFYRKKSFHLKRDGSNIAYKWFPLLLLIFSVISLTMFMSKAESINRIISSSEIEEGRLQIWPYILNMSWKYFPFGSGAGTFVEIYQIDEPINLLSPAYLNHAHNDWLELLLTTGIFGIAIVLIAMLVYFLSAWQLFQIKSLQAQKTDFAKLGLIIILFLSLGSLVDYPLRSPSLACVFVIACLWVSGKEIGHKSVASRNV
jgi:O-antigen ligase